MVMMNVDERLNLEVRRGRGQSCFKFRRSEVLAGRCRGAGGRHTSGHGHHSVVTLVYVRAFPGLGHLTLPDVVHWHSHSISWSVISLRLPHSPGSCQSSGFRRYALSNLSVPKIRSAPRRIRTRREDRAGTNQREYETRHKSQQTTLT